MKIAAVLQRILPPVWLGMVAATAIEAVLKFQAPGITRELGLGIGKIVFTATNRIEIGIAAILALALFVFAASKAARVLFAFIAVIFLLQTFWLMPALIARIDAIVAGQPPAASSPHIIYVALEMAKLVLLLALSAVVSWPVKQK